MAGMTVLRLAGVGVPPYAARGLTQTLTPIPQSAQLRRTVNGDLIDLSAPQFRRFASTITGSDQEPPAVGGVWPGRIVTVDCIAELAVEAGEEATETEPDIESLLDRPAVDGSVRRDGDFVFYRPRLTMRVVSFSIDADEWGAQVGWSMALEET